MSIFAAPPTKEAAPKHKVDQTDARKDVDVLVHKLCEVIVGKERPIRLAVACLLARGHLLI